MPPFIVSGKKLEEAEENIRQLELQLAATQKENSMLKEQVETLTTENQELKAHVDNVLVSVGKNDIEKAKDELVGKAKSKVGDYLKTITS